MITQILVPLDGSPLAQSALPYALALADATQAPVQLFQVVPPPDVALDDIAHEDELSKQSEQLGIVKERLASVAQALRAPTRRIEIVATHGEPASEIVRAAEATAGTVVVMATHGRGGILRWAFGSVARKVLTTVSAPILIVRPRGAPAHPELPATIRTVLAPLDGSERAERVLALVQVVARAFGASVTLARVLHTPGVGDPFTYTPVLTQAYFDKAIEEWHRTAQTYLTLIQHRLSAAGIPSETLMREGNAAETLLELLDGGAYDLVVMASHGRTGMKRWVLGSVAERLIEGSQTPVLLVRSADASG